MWTVMKVVSISLRIILLKSSREKWSPVALSPQIRDSIVRLYGLPEGQIPVVRNGIDLSRCQVKTYSMKMMVDAEANKAQVRLKQWESTYRKDSLTGLLNHAAFRSDVELKLLEGKYKALMMMVDVDKFKAYNDSFGHHNGDKFLILVAQALAAALRKDDCACRMGGDEFAAALFFAADTPEAVILERAQQIFDRN